MFISFEGIDGSGKSTQARLLASAFREKGRDVTEVREPGGTGIGEAIRSLVLDPDMDITPRSELLLFVAARAQLISEVIAPALEADAIVIADRYADSSIAYQGAGRGLADPELFATLHSFACEGYQSDRTYLVDIPLENAMARRGTHGSDRIERGGVSFYRRVRQGYLDIASRHPARVCVLDGTQSVERLHSVILQDLSVV